MAIANCTVYRKERELPTVDNQKILYKLKIYLAIPYSGMEKESFFIANQVSAELMNQDHIVFSPISHSHPMAVQCSMPSTWDYWEKFDRSFIEWADEIWVVDLGYERLSQSKGVQAEIQIGISQNKPIRYINPITLKTWNK